MFYEHILTILLCILIGIIAKWKNIFTLHGTIITFIIGSVIGILGNIIWLAVLLIFLISSFAVTKFKYNYKLSKGLGEGKRGERGVRNILANGLIPVIIAIYNFIFSGNLLFFTIMFLCAVSVAAADTISSELGVLSKKVYLVTTLEQVPPGTNGGISFLGTFTGLIGSMYVSLIGCICSKIYLPWLIIVPIISGTFGNFIDSFLGALLENKGYITKGMVNHISICAGVIFGCLLWLIKF